MKTLIRSMVITLSLLVLAAWSAWAGDLTIPNTFTGGTTAVAGQVNGNFTAVETEVDDNAAEILTKQDRVTGTCPAGQSIRAINANGTVTCEPDDNSGGDITAVNSGVGTQGGSSSGSATISFDCSEVSGSGIRCDGEAINVYSLSASDGSPDNALYVDPSGNVGIGTTSLTNPLTIRSSSIQSVRISTSSAGSVIEYQADGGDEWWFGTWGSSMRMGTSTDDFATYNDEYYFGTTEFRPWTDGSKTLGSSTERWFAVYALIGTIQTSDMRLKKNVHPISYGLQEIISLNPVSYQWKDKPIGKRLGLVAQDVKKIIPEVVDVGDDSFKTLGLNYSELVPVLIKAIQEQQDILEKQKNKIHKLEKENTLIKTEVNETRGVMSQAIFEINELKLQMAKFGGSLYRVPVQFEQN